MKNLEYNWNDIEFYYNQNKDDINGLNYWLENINDNYFLDNFIKKLQSRLEYNEMDSFDNLQISKTNNKNKKTKNKNEDKLIDVENIIDEYKKNITEDFDNNSNNEYENEMPIRKPNIVEIICDSCDVEKLYDCMVCEKKKKYNKKKNY